jgi:DNA-binding NtrC family response regulator
MQRQAQSSLQKARTVLLASADLSLRQRLSDLLTGMRWQVSEATGGAEALNILEERPCEAFLLDTWLPDLETQELAAYLHHQYPSLELVCMDGSGLPADTAARNSRRSELLFALHRAQDPEDMPKKPPERAHVFSPIQTKARVAPRGLRSPQAHGFTSAGGFLRDKNIKEEDRLVTVSGDIGGAAGDDAPTGPSADAAIEADAQRPSVSSAPALERRTVPFVLPEMAGASAAMRQLAQQVRLVAPRRTAVLIEGPTGSGKELVARALHKLSPRADRPFIVVNCAAVPESLLEAEMFGHTRGAFTGAAQSRVGRLEAAHGGTLLLDEIGEMPLSLQPKLLRFLEAGEVQRIGENQPTKVDVRVIAATHQPLAKRSEEGAFRADLFYRLSVFTLRTGPLSESVEDIPVLAEHFLARFSEQGPARRFTADAMERLCGHSWPGNVRELAHVVERAYILAEDRPLITAEEIVFL